MRVTLPRTNTRKINARLVDEREKSGAAALGRVLTLIIDAGHADPEDAIQVAVEVSREHPCRVIALTTQGVADGSELDAEIRLGSEAGAGEVVVLRHSPAHDKQLDTLVLPLLLPDAPTVTWWPNEPPRVPSEDSLGRLSVRRITDSTGLKKTTRSLLRLRDTYEPGDTDLSWTRTTRWRGLLAATLDQAPYEPVLSAKVTGHETHPAIDLIAAWLAISLRVPVEIERLESAVGVTRVEFVRADGSIVLSRPDGYNAVLSQPGQPDHPIALPVRSLRACLAEELRRLDPDEIYGEVLCEGLPYVVDLDTEKK